MSSLSLLIKWSNFTIISNMNTSKIDKQELISKLADYVLLKISFVENLGLYHGRMGLILFLAYYSRYAKLSYLESLIVDLIIELFEEISPTTCIDLENGLAGIGWAIDHLIKVNIVEGNQDIVLKKLDQELMKYDMRRIVDFSFNSGLGGVLFYVNHRILTIRKDNESPFDSLFLSDLYNVVNTKDDWKKASCYTVYKQFNHSIKNCNDQNELLEFPSNLLSDELGLETEIYKNPLGLAGGLSGWGLKQILDLNNGDSLV